MTASGQVRRLTGVLALILFVTEGVFAARLFAEKVKLIVTFDPNELPDDLPDLPDRVPEIARSKRFGRLGVEVVEVKDSDKQTAKNKLKKLGKVLSVEDDFEVSIAGIPNDEGYSRLWGMAKIGMPDAWETSTGSRDTVVCVIDTGVDYNHPDLAANMWTNPNEIPGNGIDDDNNGYIDDVYGIDPANGDSNPMDDNDHGTHCAGTIGGVGNNNIGVVGVNHQVSIMACKFLTASGSGSISAALECLNYALMMGADVTSNSWGGGGYSTSFNSALNAAQSAGQLFVAAAGNSGTNNDASASYPSGYPQEIVIAVASTTSTDAMSSFSQYGATTVDLGAPGSDIYSTVPGNRYATFSGTSMACPHVAGAVALLKAVNPALSASVIKTALLDSCDATAALAGKVVSNGRLNVKAALALVSTAAPTAPTAPITGSPTSSPTPEPCLTDGSTGCNNQKCCGSSLCVQSGKGRRKSYTCTADPNAPTTPAPTFPPTTSAPTVPPTTPPPTDPSPTPAPTSAPQCKAKFEECSSNSDCCDNKCRKQQCR